MKWKYETRQQFQTGYVLQQKIKLCIGEKQNLMTACRRIYKVLSRVEKKTQILVQGQKVQVSAKLKS